MNKSSTLYTVRQCSECPGDAEYHCEPCPCYLCLQCKEKHVTDLKTIDHELVIYPEQFNCIPTNELCIRHPSYVYSMYCEPCEVPVCYLCSEHRTHRWMDLQRAYKTKQQQHRRTIQTIRSEALFYRPVLLAGIKADVKACQTELYQSVILTKAKTLKNRIDKSLENVDYKHRCFKQKLETYRYIAILQRYEQIYQQSAVSPLKFISCTKKDRLPKILLTLHTTKLLMLGSLNKKGVTELLNAIQMKERGKRHIRNDQLLTPMSALTVTSVDSCDHISCVTSDLVWVKRWTKLILTNTAGENLHCRDDTCIKLQCGAHTVNSEREIIYIDNDYNVKKLSKNMKTITTFIKSTPSGFGPRCLYCSPVSGDLLVGVSLKDTDDELMELFGMCAICIPAIYVVERYNQTGQLIQTIERDNTDDPYLIFNYKYPNYITENNNGDIVVSYTTDSPEYGSVLVRDRGGKYRFNYKGPPSGSEQLDPRGVCIDALSHILVCDGITNTVQMLDCDGQFLSHLLIRPSGIFSPRSLSYDVNTHRLWVGSERNNKVCVFRYITRKHTLADQDKRHDVMESLREIPAIKTQGNRCLLKLVHPFKLLEKIIMPDDLNCTHISLLTASRAWVSDSLGNLYLTSKTSKILHRIVNLLYGSSGSHTVNGKCELIYIDTDYNINKLRKDLRACSVFIRKIKDSIWKPRCVFCSLSTGDLLVGMYSNDLDIGKVTRYNQSGQLTQTIQDDGTGLELYYKPSFIAENNNGNVVVSDSEWSGYYSASGAVVVTDRCGKYRFSYTGHPPGSGIRPRGICTDALSNIVVCDDRTQELHILNSDGQFLSLHLPPSSYFQQRSVSYDADTYCLWVCFDGELHVYKYISLRDSQTGGEGLEEKFVSKQHGKSDMAASF
ncbi:uncharacterized protein LOC128174628 [Crassostrea angulata]|uniref:uncharacterized protein LOC128174628 n=1 Tax=Magallana angulata TaxID=2784310 RepID=UPI0022B12D4E|nr:uncharacterized protein LOC128174628 [Crassostrea angulata]